MDVDADSEFLLFADLPFNMHIEDANFFAIGANVHAFVRKICSASKLIFDAERTSSASKSVMNGIFDAEHAQ